jgi:2-methylisocitrate lyase-like PEP mutase family enzyme
MDKKTQQEKAARLRQLHDRSRILVLPNAWDAASAVIFEEAGFAAIATTSAGVAWTLGYADGERISREEMLSMVRRIAAQVRLPVTADMEAGYGPTPEDTVKTVEGVLAAGAVGMNLEDGTRNPHQPLVEMSLQVEKIQAARSAAEAMGIPLVLNARTDAFHVGIAEASARLGETVRRANAYRAAGADCLFVPAVRDAASIATLVREIAGPLNVLAVPGLPSVAELEKLGVARLSVGSGPARATLSLLRRIAAELRGPGTFTSFTVDTISHGEVNSLVAKQ